LIITLRERIANNRSALTEELQLVEDNSDPIRVHPELTSVSSPRPSVRVLVTAIVSKVPVVVWDGTDVVASFQAPRVRSQATQVLCFHITHSSQEGRGGSLSRANFSLSGYML